MKEEKLGFFKKMFLVITDFRTYPFIVKHERFLTAIKYFFKLVALISLILAVYLGYQFEKVSTYVIDNYAGLVPDFTFSNGTLNISEEIYEKLNNTTYLAIDTNYSYDDFIKSDKYIDTYRADNLISINNDRLIVENNNQIVYGIQFSDYTGFIDKSSLYNDLLMFKQDIGLKLQLWIFAYGIIFISYFISVIIKVLFIALIISILCMFRGIMLDIKNYIKIAIYVYTLPLLVEVLVLCIAGPGKTYTEIASFLLLYVYIVYALRAIRLDAFIMMISRKGKFKNNSTESSEIQEELEKYQEITQKDEDDIEDKKDDNEEGK